MKIIAINGSRRRRGNTAHLLTQALDAAKAHGMDTELIHLADYQVEGCRGCEGCRDTYECVIDDDMPRIMDALASCDGVILGSPTYFYNITARMKAFIERLYAEELFDDMDRSIWLSVNEARGGKLAAVIAVCEQNDPADMGMTTDAMKMPLEALGYRVVDTVKVLHLYERGAATQSQTAQQQAQRAGERLAKTLQLRAKVRQRLGVTIE